MTFSQKQNKTNNNNNNKKCSKTQLFKNLPFHDILHHFVFLYFSTACGAASALRGGGLGGLGNERLILGQRKN